MELENIYVLLWEQVSSEQLDGWLLLYWITNGYNPSNPCKTNAEAEANDIWLFAKS